MPSAVYHATLAIISSRLQDEGYQGRTTNRTEFFRVFDDDQEGTILIRSKNDVFSYHWSYRSSGVILDQGVCDTVHKAISEIQMSQTLDSEFDFTMKFDQDLAAHA